MSRRQRRWGVLALAVAALLIGVGAWCATGAAVAVGALVAIAGTDLLSSAAPSGPATPPS